MIYHSHTSTLFPYTTLFRSDNLDRWEEENPDVVEMLVKRGLVEKDEQGRYRVSPKGIKRVESKALEELFDVTRKRSEEHTSELQSRLHLVCRLLLEKKNNIY